MAFVYLVPARLGSQGLVQKNLQEIDGRSLVEIAVKEAMASRYHGDVWVNSDSDSITNLGLTLGAKAYVRPQNIARSDSTADQVVSDFIANAGLALDDVIIYLQPTSPFRKKSHIEESLKLFLDSGQQPVTSVTRVGQHPQKMLKVGAAGELSPYQAGGRPTANRQGLEEVFIPNGAIYVFTVRRFLQSNGFPVHGSIPYLMGEDESLDIDNPLDLEIARFLSRKIRDEEIHDGE
jgi:N-acylneuraminate cytidylyltransferase